MTKYNAVEINQKLARLGRIVGEPTMNGGVKAARLLMGVNVLVGFALGYAVASLCKNNCRKR